MTFIKHPLTLIATLTMLLTACVSSSIPSDNGQLAVVSTVSPITNIIYNVGGNRIRLTGIVPEGVNSHTFEPVPSDAVRLAEADLIFINTA